MNRLFYAAAAMLLATGAQAQVMLTSTEYYGNAMSGGSSKSSEIKYFYDANAKLVSKLELTGTGEPFQRTEYNYNDKGFRVSETMWQWGQWTDGEDAWHSPQTTDYIIDQYGNIAAVQHTEVLPWGDKMTYNEFEYKWDAQGNKIEETYFLSMRGAAPEKQYTITYSDFSAGTNKPAKAVKKSIWESENYEATYTYDANGNPLEYLEEMSDPDQAGASYGKKETWEYSAAGVLTTYTTYVWVEAMGEFYAKAQERYEVVDGNANVLRKTFYVASPWFDGDQVQGTTLEKQAVSQVDKYVDFTGMAEYMGCEISATVSDANTNTVKVTATIPEGARMGSVRYDLYRDSELAHSKLLSDIMKEGNADGDNNLVYLFDANVKNGTHKYFVQIVKPADDEAVEEASVEWIGFNVSNVAEVTAEMQNLPKATNLKLVSASTGDGTNGTATISYEFPETIDAALGFTGNYLFIRTLGSFRMTSDSSTSKAGNGTLQADLIASETIDAYIESRYAYGNVQSDIVTLDMTKPTVIRLADAAKKSAMFFDMSGRQVIAPKAGAYIMIEAGKAQKVVIK